MGTTSVVDPRVGGVRGCRSLVLIAAAAAALRLTWVAWYSPRHRDIGGDALYYHAQANALARGAWFVEPNAWLRDGSRIASALHPPLYPAYLGAVSPVAESVLAHRIASAALGTATVALIFLVGRRIGGTPCGAIAAGVAALYPPLWVHDALLMSETMFAASIGLVLVAEYRRRACPTVWRAAVVGVAVALATLCRAEALLLLVLLGAPTLWRRTSGRVSWRGREFGAFVAGVGVLLVPWSLYNATRFERPVPVSNGLGTLLLVGNCDATYDGPGVGSWAFECFEAQVDDPTDDMADQLHQLRAREGDESQVDAALRRTGSRYLRAHAGQVPRVAFFRLERTFQIYKSHDSVLYEALGEGHELWPARLELWSWYALLPIAVAGMVVLMGRRGMAWPIIAMLVLTIVTSIGAYGNVRFRVAFDVAVPLLAAVALMAARSAMFGEPLRAGVTHAS